MSEISHYFCEDDKQGYVSFNAKQEEKYYKKYKMHNERVGCGKSVSIGYLRYINWSDITGFVISRSSNLSNLCRKRHKAFIFNPPGFDHTTFWRKPGDRWPSFCLTEPYHIVKKDKKFIGWVKLAKMFNLSFKIFEKSQKSLWYPDSTYMVFWWCPNFFNFSENENLLMSHEDADDFEKKCKVFE